MPTTYNDASTTYNQSTLSYIGEAGGIANLPAIGVYAAFNTESPYDDLPQWTDITSYVREANVKRGRTDDLQKFPPATASLVLDNNLRLFDPFDTGLVTERTNLVTNPSFETNTTGWGVVTNLTLARSTTYALNGSASMSCTVGASATASTTTSTSSPVVGSTAYTASSYVRSTAARNAQMLIEWRTSADAVISSSTGVATAMSTTIWTRISLTATAPSNAAYARVIVQFPNSVAADVHYIDSVLFESSSTLQPYFDGSTYGITDPTITSVWNGTPHLATSTVKNYRRRTNLVVNPSFELNVNDMTAFNPSGLTLARSTAKSYSGVASVAGTTAPLTSGDMIISTSTTTRISVGAGSTYTASLYVLSAATVRSAYVRIRFYGSAGTMVGNSDGVASNTSTTTWGRRTVTGIAPETAVTATIEAVFSSAVASETHYADAFLFEQSSTVGDYFDGDTYASGSVGVGQSYWTGALENSTSYLLKYPRAVHLRPRTQIKIEATWDSTTYTVFRGFVAKWPVEWREAGKDSTVTIDCYDLLGLLTTEAIETDWASYYTKQLLSYGGTNGHYWKFDDAPQGFFQTVRDYVGGLELSSSTGGAAFGMTGTVLSTNYISEAMYVDDIQATKAGPATPANGFVVCLSAKGVVGRPSYEFRARRGYKEIRVQVNADGSVSGSYRDNVGANGYTFSLPAGTVAYDQPTGWTILATPNQTIFKNNSGYFPYTGLGGWTTAASIASNSTEVDSFVALRGFFQECYTCDVTAPPSSGYYTGVTTPYKYPDGSTVYALITTPWSVMLNYNEDWPPYRIYRYLLTTKISSSRWAIYDTYEKLPPNGDPTDTFTSLKNYKTSDQAMREILRTVDGAQGFFWCNRNGILIYAGAELPFQWSAMTASQATFTDSGVGIGYDKGSVRIDIDGDNILNAVTMSYVNSGQYTASNGESIRLNGAAATTIDTDLSYGQYLDSIGDVTDIYAGLNSAQTQAEYVVRIFKNPKMRISPFLVRGQQNPSYNWPILLSLDLLNRVTFKRTPSVGSALSKDLIVQAIEHRITPALWETTITGSARFTNWFIVGKSLIGGEDLLL